MSKKVSFSIAIMMFLFLTTHAQANASSISATGTVHSKTASTLKIVRPDGSTVNASCSTSVDIGFECDVASVGMPVWGVATCSAGVCAWTCLDVRTEPCGSNGFVVGFNGIVTAKEMCAGQLYLTLTLANGTNLKGACLGATVYSQCQARAINSQTSGIIKVYCQEGDWLSM